MATNKIYYMSGNQVLRGLAELRDQKLLCDVHLVVEDETFPVHRVVLAAASPYFQAMFTGGFKETGLDVITLQQISAEGLKVVLDAIYTNEIQLSDEIVDQVVAVANLMQMDDIVKICETYITENLTENNCLIFLEISEKYELHEAATAADNFVVDNIEAFAATAELTRVTKIRLCRYLAEDKLRLPNGEFEVFRAAVKWIENNSDNDKNVSAFVLQHVRFPFIPVNLLLDNVQCHPLVERNTDIKLLVKEAVRFHSHTNTQPLQVGQQYKPRGEQKILLIRSGEQSRMYDVHDTETKMHTLRMTPEEALEEEAVKTIPMAFATRSMTITGIKNYLFLHATDNQSFNPVFLRYDTTADQWIDLRPPPQKATIGSVMAQWHDKIYLFGGMFVEKSDPCLVPERFTGQARQYSIPTNSWAEIESVPHAVVYASAVSHGDCIFLAGGTSNNDDMASVYAYDITANIWLRKNSMTHPRANFCLQVIDNSLYACGGRSHRKCVPSIEVFNIPDNQWTLVQGFTLQHRIYSSSFVAQNKNIFIIGGTFGENDFEGTDLISCFDVENKTAREFTQLTFKCANHVCIPLLAPIE